MQARVRSSRLIAIGRFKTPMGSVPTHPRNSLAPKAVAGSQDEANRSKLQSMKDSSTLADH
jgi:hypothetical protein